MMIDEDDVTREQTEAETELTRRRDFLTSLRRWSHAVIGGVVLGGFVVAPEAQAGWINSRGRWVKRGDGFSAIRGGSWINGGGGWLNSGTNWINRRGTWVNAGAGSFNRGGGAWLNSRGGGGLVNQRGAGLNAR